MTHFVVMTIIATANTFGFKETQLLVGGKTQKAERNMTDKLAKRERCIKKKNAMLPLIVYSNIVIAWS